MTTSALQSPSLPADGQRILAGIDEAGLGPVLGPLAIGYSVFAVPAGVSDLWAALRGTVAKRRNATRALLVADSKVVFSRTPVGRRRLEATVLAFDALLDERGKPSATAERFLFRALRPHADQLGLPWYARLPALPCAWEAATLEIRAAVLQRAIKKAGAALLDAGVRIVPEGELNASYSSTKNKAISTWTQCREVLRHLWERHHRARPAVVVDMLGGWRRYGSLLAQAFPEAEVKLEFERTCHSAYRLDARDGAGGMDLEFRARAESASFPVALASCFAKYARELVMEAFNAYFADLDPALRPTAGYRGDAWRWLREATGALEKSGLTREVMVRER